jgi:hypothetical protein
MPHFTRTIVISLEKGIAGLNGKCTCNLDTLYQIALQTPASLRGPVCMIISIMHSIVIFLIFRTWGVSWGVRLEFTGAGCRSLWGLLYSYPKVGRFKQQKCIFPGVRCWQWLSLRLWKETVPTVSVYGGDILLLLAALLCFLTFLPHDVLPVCVSWPSHRTLARWGWRPPLPQYDLTLTNTVTLFPNKPLSRVCVCLTPICVFWGYNSIHNWGPQNSRAGKEK